MKKRGWLVRNFGWIRNDVRELFGQLKKGETWVLIGILSVFFLLAFFATRFALRSDVLLRALHPSASMCRELGENAIAFLFFSIFFFGLTALATLGEFVTYIDAKRRHAHYNARGALKGTAGWGAAALVIGLAVVIFLDSRCT